MKFVKKKPHEINRVNRKEAYSITYSFINNTDSELVIVDRTNVPTILSKPMRHKSEKLTANRQRDHLMIVVKFEVTSSAQFAALKDKFAADDAEAKIFREAYDRAINISNSTTMFEVAYRIGYDEIDDTGAVYFDLLDIVISNRSDDQLPLHPRSEAHIKNLLDDSLHEGVFNFNIYIVDKTETFTRRWVRLGDSVFQIPIISNIVTEDGIYYVTKENGDKSEKMRFDLEDPACPIKLYHSKEEATMFGGPDAELERENRRISLEAKQSELALKQELEQMKAKAEAEKIRYERAAREERERHERNIREEKQAYEREKIEREKRYENEKIERERRDAEERRDRERREADEKERREAERQRREEKSNKHKTTVELLKIIPPLVTVVTLVATIWISRK